MNESSEYTVKFGRIARTIEYKDLESQIMFTLDGSPRGPKWITLEHHAPRTPRAPQYSLAFDRVKQYLESCGFQVEVYGEALENKNAYGPEIETLLYEDSRGKLILHFEVDASKSASSEKPILHFLRGGVFTNDGQTVECETQEEQERFSAALERGKQFLVAQGYEVQE
jgi:hypothetical protein